jgi:hypothetical protein
MASASDPLGAWQATSAPEGTRMARAAGHRPNPCSAVAGRDFNALSVDGLSVARLVLASRRGGLAV